MRKELKDICEHNYWCYGLREDDFEYTINLVKKFVNAQNELFQNKKMEIENEYSEDISCEIISDIAHYNWVDNQYLWHFCLWRLQAIFEGLITYSFLKSESKNKLGGLKVKLNEMRVNGFTIDSNDSNELLDWAKLRNAFSHAPPEHYSPIPLEESDINEYHQLLLKVCSIWRKE